MKTAPHLHRDTRFASSQISEIHAKRTGRAAQWNPRFFLENLISLHYIFNLSDCGKGDRNCSYTISLYLQCISSVNQFLSVRGKGISIASSIQSLDRHWLV